MEHHISSFSKKNRISNEKTVFKNILSTLLDKKIHFEFFENNHFYYFFECILIMIFFRVMRITQFSWLYATRKTRKSSKTRLKHLFLWERLVFTPNLHTDLSLSKILMRTGFVWELFRSISKFSGIASTSSQVSNFVKNIN